MSNTASQYGTQNLDPKRTGPITTKGDNSWILDQLDLRELDTWSVDQQQAAKKQLCDYSETFSKND